jgi:hypothetical protein
MNSYFRCLTEQTKFWHEIPQLISIVFCKEHTKPLLHPCSRKPYKGDVETNFGFCVSRRTEITWGDYSIPFVKPQQREVPGGCSTNALTAALCSLQQLRAGASDRSNKLSQLLNYRSGCETFHLTLLIRGRTLSAQQQQGALSILTRAHYRCKKYRPHDSLRKDEWRLNLSLILKGLWSAQWPEFDSRSSERIKFGESLLLSNSEPLIFLFAI